MSSQQHLMMDPPERTQTADAAHSSTLKSILVHIQDDPTVDQRLEAALSLARPTSAHLSCVHVTPILAYAAFDGFGGVFVMQGAMEALDEREAKLRSRIETKLRAEDVSWDYDQVTGDVVGQIVGRAAFADLVVTARDRQRDALGGSATGLLGDFLYRCRSPLFIPGDDVSSVDPMGTAVIAWDGSGEAANAIRSCIGMLKLAQRVKVVQVVEEKDQRFPGTKMLEYLSRHGIHAELSVQEPPAAYSDPKTVAATIVSYARGCNAAYLVMGGYSHSRMGEYVFGGVTRTLLEECPIALVVAH